MLISHMCLRQSPNSTFAFHSVLEVTIIIGKFFPAPVNGTLSARTPHFKLSFHWTTWHWQQCCNHCRNTCLHHTCLHFQKILLLHRFFLHMFIFCIFYCYCKTCITLVRCIWARRHVYSHCLSHSHARVCTSAQSCRYTVSIGLFLCRNTLLLDCCGLFHFPQL